MLLFSDKAPLTKVILGTVGASTVLASLMNWKPWLPLQLERVFEDGQVSAKSTIPEFYALLY